MGKMKHGKILGIVIAIIILISILYMCYVRVLQKDPNDIFQKYVYLDNNGTTPPHFEAIKKMQEYSRLGNISSAYAHTAKNEIEKVNIQIGKAVGSVYFHPVVVVHTSGASESNSLFLRGVVDAYWINQSKKDLLPHLIISSIEHKTSIECAKHLAKLDRAEITFISPRINGIIDPMEVAYAIRPNTIGISVMHVNNETGAINDIESISKIASVHKIPYHIDIAQSFGKIPISWTRISGIIALSISFHKLYGPTGVGALILSENLAQILQQVPQICGTQNSGLRGGTENIAGIIGAGEAVRISMINRMQKNMRILQMKIRLIQFLNDNFNIQKYEDYAGKPDQYDPFRFVGENHEKPIVVFLGPTDFLGLPDLKKSASNTLLISFIRVASLKNHFCNIMIKKKLFDEGVIVSIGSACNTSDEKPSHILESIKAPYIVRCGVIRISLGDYNTSKDIKKFEQAIVKLFS
jgi:cysteine desulfurase